MRTLIFAISLALASFALASTTYAWPSEEERPVEKAAPEEVPEVPAPTTSTIDPCYDVAANYPNGVKCADWGPSCVPGGICWLDSDRVFKFGDEVWTNISDSIYIDGIDENGFVYPHRFNPNGANSDDLVPAIVIGVLPASTWCPEFAEKHMTMHRENGDSRDADELKAEYDGILVYCAGSAPHYTVAIESPDGRVVIQKINRVIPEQAVMLSDW